MTSVGRPTKYTEKLLKTAQDYFCRCQENGHIPYIEELSLELDINDDTLVEWAAKHEEFSATIKRLRLLQKLHLKKDALERKIHPTMSIFLLKANHGLDEKKPEIHREEPNIVITFVPPMKKADQVIAEIDKGSKQASEKEISNLKLQPE